MLPDHSGDMMLFGETQSCCILTCRSDDEAVLRALAKQPSHAGGASGMVGGNQLRVLNTGTSVTQMREAYETGLAHALEGVTANA